VNTQVHLLEIQKSLILSCCWASAGAEVGYEQVAQLFAVRFKQRTDMTKVRIQIKMLLL
jgi:hypothetical protein